MYMSTIDEQCILPCSCMILHSRYILPGKFLSFFCFLLLAKLIVKFVYIHADPTLTLNNVTAIMKDVWQWEKVADWVGISDSKHHELESQSSTTDQAKQACWDYWLHHHPAPSWRILADGIYFWGKHGALEVLQMNYLKGEYALLCACHGTFTYTVGCSWLEIN